MHDVNLEGRRILRSIGTERRYWHWRRAQASPGHKAKIGLQLYTLREAIESDFEKTMRKVADIGFLGIETFPLPGSLTVARAARVFKNLGLKVLGMHAPLPVGDQRDAVLKEAESYNCDRIIFAG
jgi:sugar phosphate isomerase/epimerase